MGCTSCGRDFHWECETGCDNCHGELEQKAKSLGFGTRGAPVKNVEDITDPYSTGRKRAAIQYPIHKTNPCEWRGKKNCGGGTPIIGCIDGLQIDRHHGPIKDPLENSPGNVHRICKKCHNRWHVVNDPIYDRATYAQTKHEPQPADEWDLLANESYWKMNK